MLKSSQIIAFCGIYLIFWWNLPQNLLFNATRTAAELKTKGCGQPWQHKKHCLALLWLVYHKFLAKNFKLLHKRGFFFEKITPVMVNKKSDDAHITDHSLHNGLP